MVRILDICLPCGLFYRIGNIVQICFYLSEKGGKRWGGCHCFSLSWLLFSLLMRFLYMRIIFWSSILNLFFMVIVLFCMEYHLIRLRCNVLNVFFNRYFAVRLSVVMYWIVELILNLIFISKIFKITIINCAFYLHLFT